MAKLVGLYKFVVSSVDVGENEKGNNNLKLGLTFTDELVGEEYVEMPNPNPVVNWFGGLNTTVGKGGKSPAHMTINTIKKAFDFEGGFKDLHKLMYCQGVAVCTNEGHPDFTKVKWLNHINAKKPLVGFKELSTDVQEELDAIFGAV